MRKGLKICTSLIWGHTGQTLHHSALSREFVHRVYREELAVGQENIGMANTCTQIWTVAGGDGGI